MGVIQKGQTPQAHKHLDFIVLDGNANKCKLNLDYVANAEIDRVRRNISVGESIRLSLV